MDLIAFLVAHWKIVLQLTFDHFTIVLVSMTISVALGVVVGVLITFNPLAARIALSVNSVLMTIPSLALFSLLIPFLGIGKAPAIVGLIVYTQLPLVQNVYAGITLIDPATIEAARGMGLSELKILFKIKLPLALPATIAGIRTAVVMGVGVGAIAAYVGAGGLGVLIFQGISRTNDAMVLAGAVALSLMAIVSDWLISLLQPSDRRSPNGRRMLGG